MKRLSKTQLNLLECALDKLYTFLKEKFNVNYHGSVRCNVYYNLVKLHQCSPLEHVDWEVNIWLEERRIYIVTRKVEHKRISFSEGGYELHYMRSIPKTHTIYF